MELKLETEKKGEKKGFLNLFNFEELKNRETIYPNSCAHVPVEEKTDEEFHLSPNDCFSLEFPLEKNFHSLVLNYKYNISKDKKNKKKLDEIIKFYHLDKKYFLNFKLFNYSHLKLLDTEENFAKTCLENKIVFTKMDITLSSWSFQEIKSLGFDYDIETLIEKTRNNDFFFYKKEFKCDFLLIKFKRKKSLKTLFRYCDINVHNFCNFDKINWNIIKKYYENEEIYEAVKPFLDACELNDIKNLRDIEIMKIFKIDNMWFCRKFSNYQEYIPYGKLDKQKNTSISKKNNNNDLIEHLKSFSYIELTRIGFDSDSIRVFGLI